MPQLATARPGLGGNGRAQQDGWGETPTFGYSTTAGENCQGGQKALALAVYKASRGKEVIVGKCTFLDGLRIFAVAHDQQHGVDSHISLPEVALSFGESWGCRWFYFWRARTLEVRRLPFGAVHDRGYWGAGAGRELYIPIDAMDFVGTWPKPRWGYASEVLRLSVAEAETPEPVWVQLGLFAYGGLT